MRLTEGLHETVLTTGDVARRAHVSTNTVLKWVKRGMLAAYTVPGSRHRRIRLEVYEAFMEKWRADPKRIY